LNRTDTYKEFVIYCEQLESISHDFVFTKLTGDNSLSHRTYKQ